jgi:N-acetylmuramoyl-L-alanine amidase
MRHTTLKGANVKSIDMRQSPNGTLKFVFLVNGEAHWNVVFLSNNGVTRLQLTILTGKNLINNINSRFNSKVIKSSQLEKDIQHKMENTFHTLMTELENKKLKPKKNSMPKTAKFIVVIDAGHGGKDSGALGKRGSKEKNIVLSISKKLAAKINEQPRLCAVLTRNGDYFVPLRKRLQLARKGKADLFVAVHADAYFDNDATGVSVYALSQRGASNEAARWLAQQDNYSELGGVELNTLSDRDPVLRSVLVDLAQASTIQDSIRLGNHVLEALDDISSLHYKQVERAPFVVLKSPDIPSILVETGFITNPREEKRLLNPDYQDQVAQALMIGIKQYVRKYAMRNL